MRFVVLTPPELKPGPPKREKEAKYRVRKVNDFLFLFYSLSLLIPSLSLNPRCFSLPQNISPIISVLKVSGASAEEEEEP